MEIDEVIRGLNTSINDFEKARGKVILIVREYSDVEDMSLYEIKSLYNKVENMLSEAKYLLESAREAVSMLEEVEDE